MSDEKKTNRKLMNRKQFLKVTGLGALGLVLASKFHIGAEPVEAEADTVDVPVTDNLSSGGIIKSDTAPANTTALWLNTGAANGKVANGVLAYYTGNSWTPVTSVWM